MISATVICDSITKRNHRLTTLEITYPRFILSELNTHRQLSKNSSSSRAIPHNKMIQQVLLDNVVPQHLGKNQSGMQAYTEVDGKTKGLATQYWLEARDKMIYYSQLLADLNIHKQVTNRLTECFQTMKTVVTSTSWDNFFKLRMHEAAQPEFYLLAKEIYKALNNSKPLLLEHDWWHLPYITRTPSGNTLEYTSCNETLTLDEAKVLSVSCCAQVSYRNLDLSLERAQRIYNQLILSYPQHMSPCEHQAMPISEPWQLGVSHMDRCGEFYSGNFLGWIQLRKLLEK